MIFQLTIAQLKKRILLKLTNIKKKHKTMLKLLKKYLSDY